RPGTVAVRSWRTSLVGLVGSRWPPPARRFLVRRARERSGRRGAIVVEPLVPASAMLFGLVLDPPQVRLPRRLLACAERRADLRPRGAGGPRRPDRELAAVAGLSCDNLAQREKLKRFIPGQWHYLRITPGLAVRGLVGCLVGDLVGRRCQGV